MPIGADIHVAEVTIMGKINGEDYRNRIHFATTTAEFDTNGITLLTALATEVSAAFVSGFLAALSDEFSFQGVRAKRVFPALSDEVEVVSDAGPGGVAANALPSFNSMLVHKKSGKGGRKGRGRMYLPPPLETHTEKGKLLPAGLAVIEQLLDGLRAAFLGDAGSSQWVIGVLNRVYDNSTPPNNTDNNWFPSAQLLADDVVSRQGRRKIGKGS